eukprot:m.484195 g.484195  ORF g.484195 m.484195 type:complete len:376 (+) comp23241_c0_seq1:51-1178(+)
MHLARSCLRLTPAVATRLLPVLSCASLLVPRSSLAQTSFSTSTSACETMATMKAIRVREFGEPSVLKVEDDVPLPEPAAGQVRVRIEAAGVNPVETYMRSGAYAKLPELPFTPGNDGAGVVHAVGAGVTNVIVGDPVYTTGSVSGTYAQFAVCEAEQVRKLPSNVTADQGAAVGIAYRTAYRALFQRAKLRPAQTVLIHGATGGCGIAAVQLALASGARVFGTAGTQQGLELLRSQGINGAFSHREEGYMQKILGATNGSGVDVICEMLANVNLGHDLEILAKGGVVAIVGNRGNVEINPRLLMQKEAAVIGVMGGTKEEIEEAFSAIDAGLRTGALKPLAGLTYSLEDAAAAHEEVIAHKQGSGGKILLKPWAV